MVNIDFIKKHEAFREFAYPDPASPLASKARELGIKLRWGFAPARELLKKLPEYCQDLSGAPWTCGYGETEGVTIDTRWTYQEAATRLRERVNDDFLPAVEASCTVKPNHNQLAAMVSLAYNIGVGNFRKSSVLRNHNRGDFPAAAQAFHLWNKAQGKVLQGLVKRRAEEAALYMEPVFEPQDAVYELPGPIAQVVDEEKLLSQSKIIRASTVAGGTAALASVAESVHTLNAIKEGVEGLGSWIVPILLLIVVGLSGYIIWERYKQRQEGKA